LGFLSFFARRVKAKFGQDQGRHGTFRASLGQTKILAPGRKADYSALGWMVSMSETRCAAKWTRRGWPLSLAISVIGLAALIGPGDAGPKDDMTGTISKSEPAIKQDGTAAHPFADAGQCPSGTDLIIWPHGSSVPSVPPGISVCFVGDQSFDGDRPGLQVRQR
jgi:hypothetical protein